MLRWTRAQASTGYLLEASPEEFVRVATKTELDPQALAELRARHSTAFPTSSNETLAASTATRRRKPSEYDSSGWLSSAGWSDPARELLLGPHIVPHVLPAVDPLPTAKPINKEENLSKFERH